MDVASYVAGNFGKICKWRFLGEKVVQTVTWVSGLPKSLQSDLSIIVSMSNAVSVRPRHMAFPDIAFILFLSSTVS